MYSNSNLRTYLKNSASCLALLALPFAWIAPVASSAQSADPISSGELRIIGYESDAQPESRPVVCPLKHTEVTADVVGFISRTAVRQVFYNPLDTKIEAVYVFPLPQDAAVDDMTMIVGDRRVVGLIKERGEAREIYEEAKAAGHVASLLDQERPNIFTQSVANIEPGVQVEIEIRYVETLKYEDGVFEWVFPMVVGPRYIPGGGTAPAPMTTGTPTEQVPDAHKITPPIVPEGMRGGHDVSITVRIDAGMEIFDLASTLHEIDAVADGANRATVTLKDRDVIPNKDFILRYRLATDEIGDAFLAHHDERGDFFTLILQPPRKVVPEKVVPRELIFVMDTSGSMGGFPIEKSKEVMNRLIETMLPADTFNLITFAGNTRILWDKPRPNTPENRAAAQALVNDQQGGGGTEMMKAIDAALVKTSAADDASSVRIVCFLTDGYVGNDLAIIDAVKKNAGTTRVFSFGVGNSVNRYLLDGMAYAGRGEVEYVTLESQGAAAAERFAERLQAPVLTDIDIDWGTLSVADVYPRTIPDLFSAKPILVHGRLTGPAEGTITLRGNTGAGGYEEKVAVSQPGAPPDHDALASLWARAKVADLMNQDLAALQNGNFPEELKTRIIQLGLEFRLLTQFTSFVAVEEMTVTVGGEPTRIDVPVEMPDGVSYEGIFGDSFAPAGKSKGAWAMSLSRAPARGGRSAGRSFAPPPSARPSSSPPPPAAGGVAQELQSLGYIGGNNDDNSNVDSIAETKEMPASKLAAALNGLAEKIEKEGVNGALTIGEIKIVDYKVDVMIFLSDLSEATLKALTDLGFVQTGESKAVKMLTGTLDVRKLEDLAKLDAVIRVKPVKD